MRFSYLLTLMWVFYGGTSVVLAATAAPVAPIEKPTATAENSAAMKGKLVAPSTSPDSISSIPTIPTTLLQLGTDEALVPDWSKISFATLPPLATAGLLGSLHWQAGEPVDHLLTLSDFQDTFHLQDLDFYAIALATDTDPRTVSLEQFKLLHQQTLADVVNIVPDLGKLPVSSVKPIADLLHSAKPNDELDELTPLSVVVQDPDLLTRR
jgi:hypothetical protein